MGKGFGVREQQKTSKRVARWNKKAAEPSILPFVCIGVLNPIYIAHTCSVLQVVEGCDHDKI